MCMQMYRYTLLWLASFLLFSLPISRNSTDREINVCTRARNASVQPLGFRDTNFSREGGKIGSKRAHLTSRRNQDDPL